MRKFIGIDNNLHIRWKVLRDNGKPYPLSGYALRIYVNTPRGRNEIKEFSLTGVDNNIVCWQMNNGELRFLGGASVRMNILRRGQQIATVEEKDAFALSRRSPWGNGGAQTIELTSKVSVISGDCSAGTVSVLFPTFSVDDNLHLWLHGDTELYNSNFTLGEDGHLRFFNND